jgi:PAS domain-containing protein
MSAVRQRNVALILARELAVNLSMPMWIWDEDGELIYYNEHVQQILGSPRHELGVGRLDELPAFEPRDLDGNPIPLSELPSAIALQRKRPAHRDLTIVGQDGVKRMLSVTAFPLFARGGEFVGAVSVFFEPDDATSNGHGA